MSEPRPLILNVNDVEGPLYVVSTILRRAGFGVVEARSGLEALRVAEEHDPDLVVLDIRLPDVNGLEVCRRLRENPKTASIKVLHTSATFVSLDYKVQSLTGGSDGYLTQPFEPEELLATVKSLLRLRQAEQELRAVAEQLREEDRRKNEFLAMLAHELRNPLAAITTSLGVLALESPQKDAERRAREVMSRQTQHLARLVDDLLDVARVTQGKIELKQEALDLAPLLQRVCDNARATRTDPRKQELRLTLPETPVHVRGDVTRLEQVFTNLIDNASKYTPEGGHILVSIDRQSDHGRSLARVRVHDDGNGIVPELLPNIFSLFSQADQPIARTMGGLGIGLTLVRTLLELHGGSVSAASPGPGRGSDFVVALPELGGAPQASARGDSVSPDMGSGEPRRVLLVEDNLDALEVLSDLLSMWGHHVQAVPDGLRGVQKALELQPDVVFIDIGLPGIDGYEVARRIRANPGGERLRLVALTGYGSPEQKQEAARAGFDLHLVKPVQPDELARFLRDSVPARH